MVDYRSCWKETVWGGIYTYIYIYIYTYMSFYRPIRTMKRSDLLVVFWPQVFEYVCSHAGYKAKHVVGRLCLRWHGLLWVSEENWGMCGGVAVQWRMINGNFHWNVFAEWLYPWLESHFKFVGEWRKWMWFCTKRPQHDSLPDILGRN